MQQLAQRIPQCDLILGYGSGVFPQACSSGSEHSLIDLIVISDDRERFVNDLHRFGYISTSSRWAANMIRPEISFFPGVVFPGIAAVKIGVTPTARALSRLRDWGESFYLAGRLQKPIKVIHSRDGEVLEAFEESQRINHASALIAAMIALPESPVYDIFDVYRSLVNLSYMGDIRVGLAENPRKIENIVKGQQDLLEEIYRPFFENVGLTVTENVVKCSKSKSELFELLPQGFRLHAVKSPDLREALIRTLSRINRRESISQSLAGVGTAGVSASLRYLARKVSKRFIL